MDEKKVLQCISNIRKEAEELQNLIKPVLGNIDKSNEIKTNKSNKIIILQNTTIKKCDIESSDISDNKEINDAEAQVINSVQSSNISRTFRPLRETSSFSHDMSMSDTDISYVNTKSCSGRDRFEKTDGIMPLKQPTDQLKSRDNVITKNISIRSKNEDLVFETLKNNSQVKNPLQNNYTQTSTHTKSSSSSKGGKMDISSDKHSVSTVNYSRVSFVQENFNNDRLESALEKHDTSSFMTEGLLDFPSLDFSRDSVSLNTDTYISNMENLSAGNFVGLSVNIFEQLIKDEDARLDNFKTILKIREKVLLDRTRGELAWLEMQRKNLKETGKLQEASLIKKKQRGILVNHQKETHEMHRLKQMQKAASTERKSILQKQRNLIRQQLSTKNMITNIKTSTPRERRMSGPLKVIQSHTESLRSETSISKRYSSEAEKELSESEMSSRTDASDWMIAERQSAIKRSLQTRRVALEKRKKAAEEKNQTQSKGSANSVADEHLDETDIDKELSVDNIEKSSGTNEETILEEINLTSDESKTSSKVSSNSKNEKSSAAICSTKEEVNSFEDKEQDSLSSQSTESQVSLEKDASADKSIISNDKASIDKSTKGAVVDVKKRISEIMADTNALRGDKSPRLQDLYITTYDLFSPASSPPGSPADDPLPVPSILFDNEAEAISIIPTINDIEEITKYSSQILYKAYLMENLDNITISENTLNVICKNSTKSCYKVVFHLCKKISKEHYGQFKVELQLSKRPQLADVKPLDAVGLAKYMCQKLKEIFGYEKPVTSIKISYSLWMRSDEIMNMLLVETGQISNNLFTK